MTLYKNNQIFKKIIKLLEKIMKINFCLCRGPKMIMNNFTTLCQSIFSLRLPKLIIFFQIIFVFVYVTEKILAHKRSVSAKVKRDNTFIMYVCNRYRCSLLKGLAVMLPNKK